MKREEVLGKKKRSEKNGKGEKGGRDKKEGELKKREGKRAVINKKENQVQFSFIRAYAFK